MAKNSNLDQVRQEAEKAVLLFDRENELIPTHAPPLHHQCALALGPQRINSWSSPTSYDTASCLVEENDDTNLLLFLNAV